MNLDYLNKVLTAGVSNDASDIHLKVGRAPLYRIGGGLREIKAPKLHLYGATMPGIVGMSMGHNDYIAWGFTNLNSDNADLYEISMDEAGRGCMFGRVYIASVVLPKNPELFSIPAAVVLQLISYYCAAGKKVDGEYLSPDKPRNLAKSVTVS